LRRVSRVTLAAFLGTLILIAIWPNDPYGLLISVLVATIGVLVLIRVAVHGTDKVEHAELGKLRDALLAAQSSRARLDEETPVSIARLETDRPSGGSEESGEHKPAASRANDVEAPHDSGIASNPLPAVSPVEIVEQHLESSKGLSDIRSQVRSAIGELQSNNRILSDEAIRQIEAIVEKAIEASERRNRRWDMTLGLIFAVAGAAVAALLRFI
jgi:hypothetical protein